MGNTASDRAAGERHGAKAARAEGAGGPGPGKEHKIMVGSTDDPSVFSLPDSKLPGDKEFVSWQQDLDDSVKPTQQARPTVIRWSEGGKEVFISGSFNNWSAKIPLIKSHNDFVAILDLPEGEHQYKFFVDGQWVHDPSEPVVTSQLGTINNLIHVKKSDFEVFDALKLDSMESSETSCRDLSSSPPGPYSQEMYVFRSEERFKSPPILPPHLLQVILNKDTNISCDPALLPEPNHVMLNHLYALSIKIKKLRLREGHIASKCTLNIQHLRSPNLMLERLLDCSDELSHTEDIHSAEVQSCLSVFHRGVVLHKNGFENFSPSGFCHWILICLKL
nr:5'-AMP-activated protein kinase subunit beta-2 isoform X1 [Pipistrellus kuhlii]